MKKHNKNLMKVVAVLLSLVLLTSAVVSSTFAKYVVTKDASVEATLKKYNITVTLEVDERATKIAAQTIKKGDSISYTCNGVKLKPGDDYSNLITASIVGTPAVSSTITITVDVSNVRNLETGSGLPKPFQVPKANFTTLGIDGDKAYLPLAVYVGGTSVQAAYQSYTYSDTAIEEAIETIIGTKIKDAAVAVGNYVTNETYARTETASGADTKMAKVTATLATTGKTTLQGLGVGFAWTDDKTSPNNEIGTWIAKTQPTFDLKYTITVSQ